MRILLSLALALLIGFSTDALCESPSKPIFNADELRQIDSLLDRHWEQIQKLSPSLGVRELFEFALESAGSDHHVERLEHIFELCRKMQDLDPKSPTYGNFRWTWSHDKVLDRNGVEFCMQQALPLWILYKDRLTEPARKQLEELIRTSANGIELHHVAVTYTNIYLMKIFNSVAIGEAFDMPKFAHEGYDMLDQWLINTWKAGIHEYLSPTYTGTDLDSLALLARFARRAEARVGIDAALRFYWADLAANWFEPGARLGGAHSRDYDYLTGHGRIETHLCLAGWIKNEPGTRAQDEVGIFWKLVKCDPPAELHQYMEAVPRTICDRWGDKPGESAIQYIGKSFSLGSAGSCYANMDKPLTVNFSGGAKMPMVNFFMDGRGDSYGNKHIHESNGHDKSLHLTPFISSVQRGSEVLMFASIDTAKSLGHSKDELTTLCSQLVIPSDVAMWINDKHLPELKPDEQIALASGDALFLRFKDVAVGVRIPHAVDTNNQPAQRMLINDGVKYHAARLTIVHSAEKPEGKASIALWIRAAEGLDEEKFSAFRASFIKAAAEVKHDAGKVRMSVEGHQNKLTISVDPTKAHRLENEGGEPGSNDLLLGVNGKDIGREILRKVPVVAKHAGEDLTKEPDKN